MEKEEQNGFEIAKLIPNMFTMSALCLGLFSVKLAIMGQFTMSAICIIIASMLDAVDGNVARRLNASSEFGAQMDSLADFFNFGIAPGFLVYFWKMQGYDDIKTIAWIPVLILAICMAIRLARFNVGLNTSDPNDPLVKYFFTGVPAPMVAALVLMPLALETEFGINFSPLFIIFNTTLCGLLAASTIPTFTPKKIKVPVEYKQLVLLVFGLILVGMLVKIWFTMTIVLVLYIISIIVGWVGYYKIYSKRKNNK